MKKMLVLMFMGVLVLAFGMAYAGEKAVEPKDTLINYLDPSSVEAEVATGHMEATVSGEAAGGFRGEADTFLNYIDPSRMEANPAARVRSGPLEKGEGRDTLLNYIAPPVAIDWGGGD